MVRCEGEYEIADIKAALHAFLEDPALPPDAEMLMDVSRADSMLHKPVGPMRELARYYAARSEAFGSRTALVVEGLARYGLMRMAAVWASIEGVDARVFRDENEAAAWLLADQSRSGARGA